jgi:hypothetical protein
MLIRRLHRIVLLLAVGFIAPGPGGGNYLAAQGDGSKGLKPEEAGIKVNPKRKRKGRPTTFRTPNRFTHRPAPEGMEYAQVGITIWLVDSGNSKGVEQVGAEQTKERLDTNAAYSNGDTIRLGIVSPTGGYLYIVDQEQYADGSHSPAVLAFPTLTTRRGNNLIRAWESVEVPAYPSVWRFKPTELGEGRDRKVQTAEVLTIIISPRPLVDPSRITRRQLLLDKGEFEGWQARWKTKSQQFDAEDGVGQVITVRPKGVEQQGAEAIAEEDEYEAQTSYQVAVRPGDPIMVTVPLRFNSGTPPAQVPE